MHLLVNLKIPAVEGKAQDHTTKLAGQIIEENKALTKISVPSKHQAITIFPQLMGSNSKHNLPTSIKDSNLLQRDIKCNPRVLAIKEIRIN